MDQYHGFGNADESDNNMEQNPWYSDAQGQYGFAASPSSSPRPMQRSSTQISSSSASTSNATTSPGGEDWFGDNYVTQPQKFHTPIDGQQAYFPTSQPPRTSIPSYVCLVGGCTQKPFRRSADLARHLQQVHSKSKDNFLCDYLKCQRRSSAFHRKDHWRDHLREYHKEDLYKRNVKESSDWLSKRNMAPEWWRCNKCLLRINVDEHGWECPWCKVLCEPERRRAREMR